MNLERTPEFDGALHKIRDGKAFVFITGRAGTGKSTLLRYFVDQCKKRSPVLAPTGVAALNVGGETIHRFFKIPPSVDLATARMEAESRKKPEIYRKIETIIIDEISMVRADLFDAMDLFLQIIRQDKRPFGGVRIIGIGDLYQLPPVVTSYDRGEFDQKYQTPYFFSSLAYKNLHAMNEVDHAELSKIYRQNDEDFIELLNAIRNRDVTPAQLSKINSRIINGEPPEDSILLTPTNEAADFINQRKLGEIQSDFFIFEGVVDGKFKEKDTPTDVHLVLKVGARVMCVANDLKGQYVNGSLGFVVDITDGESPCVTVQLDDVVEPVKIEVYKWNIHRSKYNKRTQELTQEEIGSFKQIPLRLAWAVTIHKSQGKTFNKVTLDLGRGAFAAGQIYVALSRCRDFEGLSLIKPVTISQLKPNDDVANFFDNILGQPAEVEYMEDQEDGQLYIA
ncbi:MAG: DEAD/DEAH box helicase [Patescibacteria group bacterium]|nr:DEAD/DEAH box helicase [Patescibacteria group bacterium]